ncbi:DNA-binding transcriptional regulator, LysR family [Actinokineospora alba]|uniref:DNA-binding transcriptional regulator, LysR family n=1 Tax=Actinokineospora alba TaxID=504798 RepID=A0A1H0SY82_9PSEU|nr:LysR family transcriptional regulator [Actinokineospora alba]TDP66496.1 DNA-binding transcriptional LysR family regulator [Actinokineospora alba]SDJ36340.1 DNA-binding transcriptional regulator, LysR family [Actinokineospora alba]SDP46198.1 DNA-binding transcriptional regulator, LysR family [Actinokineospora alba]
MAELEIRHLRAICAIADEGSVSRAAIRLGVTQPALTAQLRSIERLIGGELFRRSPNGSVPTELGRSVVRSARIVLEDMSALLATARSHVRQPGKTPLVIASTPLLFTSALIGELRAWFAAELRTEIDSSAPALLDLVVAKQADLAIFEKFEGMEHRTLTDVEVRTIVEEPQFVALSADSPLAEQDEIDLVDLADLDWVVPPPDQDSMRLRFRSTCESLGFTPRITHHVTEGRTAMALAAAGAVCLAQPASLGGPGFVIRPLRGSVLSVPVVVVIRLDGMFAARRQEVYACVAHAYRSIVERNPTYAKWWDKHPEAHTDLDAALALPRPSRPS